MANYDVTVSGEQMQGVFGEGAGLSKLIEVVLNQVLEAQMTEHLSAESYERTEQRQGYRNGYRPRQLYTRVGTITLLVPQTRDGSFSAELFRRYQRSEQAFVLGLMEMVVQGVSTRKVTEITEQLCGVSFSKSTVSQLTVQLDARVRAFNERRLEGSYPFVYIDAMYTKSREADRVVSKAALIASGVTEAGVREVLGVRMGDSENEATWEEMFRWLRDRGLKGVDYVVSDDHRGLVKALRRQFQGTVWQRCQVHLMRNVLSHAPRKCKADMAAWLKRVLHAEDDQEARRQLVLLCEKFEKQAPKAVACLEAGFDDAIAVMSLPGKYRVRLRTTNMQERLIEEIRRRERVIRIFPNEAAALRMIGALLAEQHETWQERRYLDMQDYLEHRDSVRHDSLSFDGSL